MTLFQDLQTIGLSPNQSQVYLTLFHMGSAKAGEIIKKTVLHRNLVYVALEELIEKKLVTSSQARGVRIYKVLSPGHLLSELQERERVAKHAIEELAHLTQHATSQEIVIYEGIDEFRRQAMRTYSMAKPKEVLRYLGISPRWHEIMGPTLSEELETIHHEKRFIMRAVAKSISSKDKEYIARTKGITEIRVNPLVSSNTNGIEILDDRISIRSFLEPYFVIEIMHKDLAKNYQNYFDFLWHSSK